MREREAIIEGREGRGSAALQGSKLMAQGTLREGAGARGSINNTGRRVRGSINATTTAEGAG